MTFAVILPDPAPDPVPEMSSASWIVRSAFCFLALCSLLACSPGNNAGGGREHGRRTGGGMPGRPGVDSATTAAAVPVQVQPVIRRTISDHLEANGTLQAEHEVDLVARTSGPITELLTEEGEKVRADQLLARIDDREASNQVAMATVNRDEAALVFNRAHSSWQEGLVSQEAHDSALAALESAEAQLESARIQLAYTEIRAPFEALVVTRYVRRAEHVNSGTPLFRVSDFNPLLCPVEVPEKDLPRLRKGQPARLRVEAFPGERFTARVLRIRPTVNAATGTVTVTLEVDGRGRLRPGMFASVYLQTDTHEDALVIPRKALVLDSIGDTVFVRVDGAAARREVMLGFREEDEVEVLQGLNEGEELIVLGQDGLADGTPVTVLGDTIAAPPAEEPGAEPGLGPSPERLEMMRQRMKKHGLSDEEIEERLESIKEGGGRGPRMGPGGSGSGIPPFMVERIRQASPAELERIRERMRSFGMSDEQIDETIERVRGQDGNGS
jgi:membrane fusion protein (multidrug efflux system)